MSGSSPGPSPDHYRPWRVAFFGLSVVAGALTGLVVLALTLRLLG
jgi:hypothetical protein